MPPEDTQANSDANSQGAAAGAGGAQGGDAQQQQPPPRDDTVSRDAYSKLQSAKDKAEADAERARKAADDAAEKARAAEERVRQAERASKLAEMKPEERAAIIESFKIEDQKRELEEDRKALAERAKTLAVTHLVQEFGVKREDIQDLDSPEEMRARAAELKAARIEAELEELKKNPNRGTPPANDGKQPPAGMRADPAGSGGGQRTGYDPEKYKNTGNVGDAIRERMRAGWEPEVVTPDRR